MRFAQNRFDTRWLPRKAAHAAIIASTALFAIGVGAQAYPERPIKLIAPFAAGGIADVSSRIIAEHMGQVLAASVVVENRPGAEGRIGGSLVKESKPDGYTLLSGGPTALVVAPLLSKDMPFDAEKDFVPVGYTNRYDMIVVTAPSTGFTNVKSLVDTMKQTPDKINYGSAGTAAALSLAGAMLAHLSGRNIQAIDYKGAAALLPDLLAGRITYAFTSTQSAEQQIKSGKLIALAIATNKRNPRLPDVPTMAEAGFPEYMKINWSPWNGVFAPAGTPRPILEKLNASLNQTLKMPALQKRFADIGTETMEPMTLEQAAAHYRSEFSSWRPALLSLGMVK